MVARRDILLLAGLLGLPGLAASACPPLLREVGSLQNLRQTAPGQPWSLAAGGAVRNWLAPVGLAAQGGMLWVADAGLRQVFRVDPLQQTMSAVTALRPAAAANGVAMLAAPDRSLWLADASAGQLLQLSSEGRLLRRVALGPDLARPVGLASDEAGGLYVADSLLARVVRIDNLGQIRAVLKPEAAQSAEGVAVGPDGLYWLDRAGHQVLWLTPEGQLRAHFGRDDLAQPQALAADRYGRVFVADGADQCIKVFLGGRLMDNASVPSHFGRIAALALDGASLYVADSARARVLKLAVAAPCAEDEDVE